MNFLLTVSMLLNIINFQICKKITSSSPIKDLIMIHKAGIANITIVFPYQANQPVKIGVYENTFIEDQFKIITDTISNEEGELNIKVPINSPTVLISQSIHGTFRFYVVPGEKLKVHISNERNIRFEGTSERLNKFLFDKGFISEFFKLKSYYEPISVDSILFEISEIYTEKNLYLNEFKEEIDFFKYAKCEIIGGTIMDLMNLKNTLKNKNDQFGELMVDQYMDSLVRDSFTFMDESRSRRYNNFLVFCRDKIMAYEKIKVNNTTCDDFNYWRNFSGSKNKYYLMSTCCEYPEVYKLFLYGTINSLIYKAKNSESLLQAKLELDRLLKQRMEDVYLNEILIRAYQEKQQQISLIAPYFFVGQQQDSTEFTLEQKKGSILVINFWATWCKPCVASMPEFLKAAEQNTNPDIIFIAVNINDNRKKWLNFSNEVHLSKSVCNIWLSIAESKKVFSEYYFDSVPHYVVIDKQSSFLIRRANKFKEEVLPVLKNL